jgi:hypothetical protein
MDIDEGESVTSKKTTKISSGRIQKKRGRGKASAAMVFKSYKQKGGKQNGKTKK